MNLSSPDEESNPVFSSRPNFSLSLTKDEMSGLIRIRPFRGIRDGSENPEEFIDDVECAAETFEAHRNPSSAMHLEKSSCRFFRQYLAEDSDAEYWWQYILPTDDKKSFEKIKSRFVERYGNAANGAQAARSQFEIQNEIMSLQQKPYETIAEYVRNAERLAKRVPESLDSVMALCVVKGMIDETRKADISYIIHSKPKITFRDVIETIKAKHQVIGMADPFATTYLGKGRHGQGGLTGTGTSTGGGTAPYMIATHPAHESQAMVPLQVAAAKSVPSYNIARNPIMGRADVSNRSTDGPGGHEGRGVNSTSGVTEGQLFAVLDKYMQSRSIYPLQNQGQGEAGFQQPAPQAPQVISPARGATIPQGVQVSGRNQTPSAPVSPRVTCFACGRRGHYANTCQYPPLSPDEQEQLRENARAHRLQQAGLGTVPQGNLRFVGSTLTENTNNRNDVEAPEREEPRITEICERTTPGSQPEDADRVGGAFTGHRINHLPPATRTQMNNVGAACAVLSRIPPVMSILQKIMAEKRTRMEAEDSGEGVTRPMKTRRRAYMEALEEGQDPPAETLSEAPLESGQQRDAGIGENQERDWEEMVDVEQPEEKTENRDARRAPPINLMKGQEPYNIEKALSSIQPDITFPQLLDVSPRLRRELALLLRSSQPRTRKKKQMTLPTETEKANPVVGAVGVPLGTTEAAEDSEVECLYITAQCNGVEITNVLVDGGAMIELVSGELVEKLGLVKHEVKDLGIRLADDSLVRLRHYVWIDLNVEGIVARIRAYIMPVKETYQILLSRRWLKRMRGIEDHRNNILVIRGTDGIPRGVKGRPALPADFEVIPHGNESRSDTYLLDGDADAEQAIDDLLQELDRMGNLDEHETGKAGHRQ